jgi:mono/diheme cytochrome c family protein
MKPDRKQQNKPQREVHPPARSRAEDSEPATGPGGVPFVIFVVLAVALYFAMVYLDNHAGGFSAYVPRGYASSNELKELVPFDPKREKFLKGMQVYNRPTCAACHMANGQGGGNFPPLAGSEWVNEKDPSRIIRIALDGLTGPLQVKGQSFNAQMLGWRPSLNDEEISNVLTYVRQEWGNNAPEVQAEQVAKIRKETEAHAGTYWTMEDLLKVPVKSE